MRRKLALVLTLMAAFPAAAADPVARQQAIDLAYVVGEAHALAAVCNGAGDLRWRAKMNRLIELEGAEPPVRARLADSFNAGFLTRQTEFKSCDRGARAAQRSIAARGAALSRTLESAAK